MVLVMGSVVAIATLWIRVLIVFLCGHGCHPPRLSETIPDGTKKRAQNTLFMASVSNSLVFVLSHVLV
jgi:hypothetical protein